MCVCWNVAGGCAHSEALAVYLIAWVNLYDPERQTRYTPMVNLRLIRPTRNIGVWKPKENISRFHLAGLVIFGKERQLKRIQFCG